MVPAPGICCNEYAQAFERGRPLVALVCPDCSRVLCGHGWHFRFIDAALFALRRVRCFVCRKTHVVLPADLCAYRDARLPAVERALDVGAAYPTAATRAAGVRWDRDETAEAVRKVRRWFLGFGALFAQQICGLLPPCEGTWLQRTRQVVGPEPGALVRLRVWLWQKHRVLFLGPAGLRRHGGSRGGVRHASTDLCDLTRPPDTS